MPNLLAHRTWWPGTPTSTTCRSGGGRSSDRRRPRSSRRGTRSGSPAAGRGQTRDRRRFRRGAPLRRPGGGARARAGPAGRRRAALVQPYDPRIAAGETALVFITASSPRIQQGSDLAAGRADRPLRRVRHLRGGDPRRRRPRLRDLGGRACRGGRRDDPPRPPVGDLLYARVDVIGGAEDPRLLELEVVEPSLGWRQLDEDRSRSGSARVRTRRSSQPWTGWGSARSTTERGRIDAHSAAVAAVQMAAPADVHGHQCGGHPGEELHGADHALQGGPARAGPRRASWTGRGARTASSAKARPISRAQVGRDQSPRVSIDEGDDVEPGAAIRVDPRCSCRRRVDPLR